MSNKYLQNAKKSKNDEFYTTYETIEKEMSFYVNHFNNKTILCNCDDPFESNFCKYFIMNFNKLQLRRLICTSYYNSKIRATKTKVLDDKGQKLKKACYMVDISYIPKYSNEILTENQFNNIINKKGIIKVISGNGDFRSRECINLLKEADIVVTNPPFSLFKELIAILVKYKKQYLLIGNQNALTYKEIFPLIQQNKAWLGYHSGDMAFKVPDDTEPKATRFWIDDLGQKWRSIGNAMWLTNLDNESRHKKIVLTQKYDPKKYPIYDTYNAINVRNVADIPMDYNGIMGVPITFLNKYNPQQFEIIGEANHGSDNEYDLFKPVIQGKEIYKRILIKKKQIKIKQFRVLDLFCGAGGFSYGIEKNNKYKTIIAVDINQKAIDTFKYNMPNTQTIVGDITNKQVREKIIDLSKEKGINIIIGGPPCQGFSLKGKKLGLNDTRNYLFNEYLNIVEKVLPDVFVIENVKALLSTSAGWFKDQIIDKVEKMGYYVKYGISNAADFGVPQSRQRALFICCKNKEIQLPIRKVEKYTTVKDAIFDLAYLNSNEGVFEANYNTKPMSEYQKKMRDGSLKLYNHQASNHADISINKLKLIPPECGKEYLPQEMIGNQKFSGTWGRLKWNNVSPTIDTRFDASSNGTNNHPFLNRAITPREAARLQSFDDKFIFLGSKVYVRQQIGNAVPPLMAKAIADNIDKELGE